MMLLLSSCSLPLCGTNRHPPGGKVTVGPAVISGRLPNNPEDPEAMRPEDLNAIDVVLLELDCREKVDAPVGASRRLYKMTV